MITNRDDTSALELRVRPAELDRIAPLTTTQRDLYLGHEIHPDTNAYSLVVSVPLGPSIDVALWCRALALVCARDDMLRTRLLTNQGQINGLIAARRCTLRALTHTAGWTSTA